LAVDESELLQEGMQGSSALCFFCQEGLFPLLNAPSESCTRSG
jgi:hypothetical protein